MSEVTYWEQGILQDPEGNSSIPAGFGKYPQFQMGPSSCRYECEVELVVLYIHTQMHTWLKCLTSESGCGMRGEGGW